MRSLIRVVLLFSLFCSQGVSAATYNYDSIAAASAACNSASGSYPGSFCQIYQTDFQYSLIGTIGQIINRYRYSGCPDGQTATGPGGLCQAPPPDPCAGKTGTSFPFRKTGMHGDGYMFGTGGNAAAAQEGCFDGCAASTADQKCITNVSGAYRCKGTAYHIGQSCGSGGAAPVEQGEVGPDEEPSNYNDTKPCVYSSSNGVATCLSERKQGKEGRHCGSVNGVQTCVDSQPNENGIKISTTVTTTANPDGSTTTTKKDDATKTTCKGVLLCTSTSSTTTTTTKQDGNGNTTSITGNCTGPSCADANTNPDGDGDGFGDCVGDDCGGGEGGGGASDWYEPGGDTYQSVLQAYADRIAATPVLSGVTNFLTFTPSGACPVYTVDTWVFSIRLDQWCSGSTIPWQLIQAVILAVASFFAFRIAFL